MKQSKENFELIAEGAKQALNLISIPLTLEGYEGENKVTIVGNRLDNVKPTEKSPLPRSIYKVVVEFSDGQNREVAVLDKTQFSKLSYGSTHVLSVKQSGEYTASNGEIYPRFTATFGGNQKIEKPAAKVKEAAKA